MPPQVLNYAIPAFIFLLIAEAVINAFSGRKFYLWRDTAASLAMGIGNVFVNLFAKVFILAIFTAIYQARILTMPMDKAWVWVLLFFADDISYYAFHRAAHECRFFWASHVIHHSSEQYNLSTALRQTWTGNLTGNFIFWLWMPLMGFHPLAVMTMQSISLIYQFWIHTQLIERLPQAIEAIFNTPSHHRVHHGADLKYLDRNYAGILIIWDKLFRSFQVEEEAPTYGLTKNIGTYNPFRIAFHEWAEIWRDVRRAPTWRAKFGYVFCPPGWSHDGSRKTARQMQKNHQAIAATAS